MSHARQCLFKNAQLHNELKSTSESLAHSANFSPILHSNAYSPVVHTVPIIERFQRKIENRTGLIYTEPKTFQRHYLREFYFGAFITADARAAPRESRATLLLLYSGARPPYFTFRVFLLAPMSLSSLRHTARSVQPLASL
ncbi:unnamed protein product [Pieris macdunnoughi]|uniref:Uncharacterized protein n=1 Tax=Pieris macdunnoughi TaxID=345717 RepID=A0A821Y1P8_9NEOP|nr:unnamed protein product [Pieris macdunnoughi]